jgi:hypothetical protein
MAKLDVGNRRTNGHAQYFPKVKSNEPVTGVESLKELTFSFQNHLWACFCGS